MEMLLKAEQENSTDEPRAPPIGLEMKIVVIWAMGGVGGRGGGEEREGDKG